MVTALAKPEATAVSLSRSPLDGRIANALTAYAAYLRKMVWPSDLAVFYPHAFGHWSWLPVVTAGLVLVGLTALAVGMAGGDRLCSWVGSGIWERSFP